MEAGTFVYIAAVIKAEIELEHDPPIPLPSIKLKWAPGQIGALPVFETRKEAETWANGICEVLAARVGKAEETKVEDRQT